MINLLLALFIILFVFYSIKSFFLYFFTGPKRDKLGIPGKLIWMDKGRQTKPFFNHVYGVLGKPDLMYKIKGGVLAVEYKSRSGSIYASDIVQTKCASLAARGSGYKITQCLIITATERKYFDLSSCNDRALFKEIEPYVLYARQAKAGEDKLPATPERRKCGGCAFSYGCTPFH